MSGTILLNIETAIGSLGRASPSAPVSLGTLTFTGVEVPSLLRVGSEQALIVHKLIGGDRVIQSMGNDPASLSLTGMFTGPTAFQRAQKVAQLRDTGKQLRFGVAGLSVLVYIKAFAYDLTAKSAVIPYALTLEVQPTPATNPAATTSALSNLVGSDIASGISSIANTGAEVASYASTAIGQAQTIVGQVTPIANLVGAGSLLAGVSDKLTAASALSSAGTNLSAAPAAAAGIISGLQSAGAGLTQTIQQAGANLGGISAAANPGDLVADMPSLSAALANAGALSAAADAAGATNRAIVNTQVAAGLTTTAAVVHS
jgi:hypothetical protein